MSIEKCTEEVKEIINERLIKLEEVLSSIKNNYDYITSPRALTRWSDRTEGLLWEYTDYADYKMPDIIPDGALPDERLIEKAEAYRKHLKSLLAEIESNPEDIIKLPSKEILSDTLSSNKEKSFSQDIFIVHGSDEAAKALVARFIEKLDLKPIILHEKASKGRTIIEKIEKHSNVGFAVILLTPDDIGYKKDQPEDATDRARQNVIMELGYFLGKIGRKRVCALYKEGVEMPSDFQGVLYIPMDSADGWKPKLAKEIREVGIEINLEGVL